MDLLQNSPKTMGASTHTFKYRGCDCTHSTHTNKALLERKITKLLGKIKCLIIDDSRIF